MDVVTSLFLVTDQTIGSMDDKRRIVQAMEAVCSGDNAYLPSPIVLEKKEGEKMQVYRFRYRQQFRDVVVWKGRLHVMDIGVDSLDG
eukprot:6990-Eustigmatos_ZCMA.PRE.1